MWVPLVDSRLGSYLPSVNAPPAPATLWHIAQLIRKSSAPFAASPPPEVSEASGITGPGASDATWAANSAICSSVNCGSFSGACGPFAAIGIRPVPTWKSTDAAPTPMRLGAVPEPCACRPWQVAQLAWKSFLPSSMVCCEFASTLARARASSLTAAYAPPVRIRPRSNSPKKTNGCRRPVRRFVRVICVNPLCGVVRWLNLVARKGCPQQNGGLFQDVNEDKERDPDHVDKVPII